VNVSLIVATFGSDEWRRRGQNALDRTTAALARDSVQPVEAFAYHDPDATSPATVRNRAAQNAIGEWLLFVDGDDRLQSGYLDAAADVVRRWWGTPPERPLALVVPAMSFDEKYKPLSAPEIPAWDRNILDVNCACIGTLVPRRVLVELGGFREDLLSLEDWELWLRAIEYGCVLLPSVGSVYIATMGGGRNSNQSPYRDIRSERHDRFPWADIARYKAQLS